MDRARRSRNLTKYRGAVLRTDRERLHGHKGVVIWFTGLSASGKSTISHYVEERLFQMGCSTYVFDGDNVRHGLCEDLGFSPSDRVENIRRIGQMVHLFIDAGTIAITAFISPFKKDRERIREIVGKERFIEVFVDCPLDICIARDPKGIYARALAGQIEDFTGISSPYEPPDSPDIVIKSAEEDFDQAAERVVDYMRYREVFHLIGTKQQMEV